MGNEWYKVTGPTLDPRSADVREIIDAAGTLYLTEFKPSYTMVLLPTGVGYFRREAWYVTFQPANLYYPHDYFHEASGETGHLFNRELHGPRAVSLFADHLRSQVSEVHKTTA